ncbi:hypothetical protein RI367_006280 [Sorochytrium milnesiophthora]
MSALSRLVVLLLALIAYVPLACYGQGNAIKLGFGCVYNTPVDSGDPEWCQQILAMMQIHTDYLKSHSGVLSDYSVQYLPFGTSFAPLDAVNGTDWFLSQRVLGVIGYAYQQLTIPGSYELSIKGVPMCDGTTTSSLMSDKTIYPTYFRTIASENSLNDATIKYLLYNNWTSIGLLYEDDNAVTTTFIANCRAYNITILDREKISVPSVPVPASSYNVWMQAIKNSGALVIVLLSYDYHIDGVLQAATNFGMFGKGYAWITGAYALGANNSWSYPGLQFVYPEERTGPVADALYQYWTTNVSTVYNYTGGNDPWSGTWFYATCAELILRRIDAILRNSTDPNKLQLLLSGAYSSLMSSASQFIISPTIMTPTGYVNMTASGDRMSRVSIMMIDAAGNNPVIGVVDPVAGVSMSATALYPGNTTVHPRAVIPISELAVWLPYSDPLGAFLILLNMLGIGATTMIAAVYVRYIKHPVIKRSSPRIVLPMLLGICIGHLSIFTTYGLPSRASCILDAWMLPICFSLVFSNLIIKSYRIYRIFASSRRIKPLSDGGALLLSTGIMLLQCIALAVWTVVDPPAPRVATLYAGSYAWTCSSASDSIQSTVITALCVYNGFWLLVGFALAYLTRSLPSDFQESKYIAMSAYTITFVCAFTLPVLRISVIPPSVQVPLKGLAVFVSLTTVNALLFGPRVYAVLTAPKSPSTTASFATTATTTRASNAKDHAKTHAMADRGRKASFKATAEGDAHTHSWDVGRDTELSASGMHLARVTFKRKTRMLELTEQGLVSFVATTGVYSHIILRKPKVTPQPGEILPVEKYKEHQGFSWWVKLKSPAAGATSGSLAHKQKKLAGFTNVVCDEPTLTISFTLDGMQKDRQWIITFLDDVTFREWQALYSA